MAIIYSRRRQGQRPNLPTGTALRLIEDHPLALHLRHAWILKGQGTQGFIPDLKRKRHLRPYGGTALNWGQGYFEYGSSLTTCPVMDHPNLTNDFTVTVGTCPAGVGHDRVIWFGNYLMTYSASSYYPSLSFFTAGGSNYYFDATDSADYAGGGMWFEFSTTKSSIDGGKIYLDGRLVGSQNDANWRGDCGPTYAYYDANFIGFGASPYTSSDHHVGPIQHCYVWDGCLEPGQLSRLAAAPYAFLEAVRKKWFVGATVVSSQLFLPRGLNNIIHVGA